MDTQDLGTVFTDALILAEFERLSSAQKGAIDAYHTLCKSFYDETHSQKIYPLNFGGTHIEDNILHIHIVDLPTQDLTHYQTVLSEHLKYVTFVDAEYSRDELYAAADVIFRDLIDQGISVVSCGVSETHNSVTVGIEPTSASTMNLKSISETDIQYYSFNHNNHIVPVRIRIESIPETCVNIQGGTQLPLFTVGVCGTYDGQPAFAMCGHGISAIGQEIEYKFSSGATTVIGTVADYQFGDFECGDCSVVRVSAGHTTNAIVGNPNFSTEYYAITGPIVEGNYEPDVDAEGTYVMKYGARGGYAYGRVEGWYPNEYQTVNQNLTGDTIPEIYHIGGLVRVDLMYGRVMGGDSGGPVCANSHTFSGTVSATELHNNNGTPQDGTDDYSTTAFYYSPYLYLYRLGFRVGIYEEIE